MSRARSAGAYVLAFFACAFVLLASGRLASLDAGHQLQAATMLALTGRLGAGAADPYEEAWVPAANGRRYEPHDLGNVVLMLPAAWLGAVLSPAQACEDIGNPPPLSRVLVSLLCAGLAAIGCAWLFRLFALYWPIPTAFLLAAAFPATTIFIAYARSAWDVLGAAVLMCGTLYYSARLLAGIDPGRSLVAGAALLAGACTFRFSLGPFIVPAAIVLAWRARSLIGRRDVVTAALVFTSLMAPSLAYNFVRTGSPLRPATAAPQYLTANNALDGSIPAGLFGLLLSPNRGLLVFCPILIAAAAVPFVWRSLTPGQRTLLACYGAGSAGYLLLIARMSNWGAFGWGPRYLVPVLPVVFFAAAIGLDRLFARSPAGGVALVTLSALLTLPPAVVNWHLATTSFPGAAEAHAPRPYQLSAGWQALVLRDVAGAQLFPDLLLVRLARHSATGLLLALAGGAGATLGAAYCATRLLARGPRGSVEIAT